MKLFKQLWILPILSLTPNVIYSKSNFPLPILNCEITNLPFNLRYPINKSSIIPIEDKDSFSINLNDFGIKTKEIIFSESKYTIDFREAKRFTYYRGKNYSASNNNFSDNDYILVKAFKDGASLQYDVLDITENNRLKYKKTYWLKFKKSYDDNVDEIMAWCTSYEKT